MNQNMINFTESLRHIDAAHIFYLTEKTDLYVENAVAYILDGVKQGDRVLMVENPRIYPRIQKELKQALSSEELELVHYINNFDFYWRKGNFHPEAILDYFEKIIGSFTADGRHCRTWGHIEWGSQEDAEQKVISYEKDIDRSMPKRHVISVCAYDSQRISESLSARLMLCHGYFMKDDSISALSFYNEEKARN